MAKSKALDLTIAINGRINKSLGDAVSSATKQLNTINAGTVIGKGIQDLSKIIGTVGRTGLATMGALTTGVAVGLSKCTDAATEFESGMTKVYKYVNGLADETGKIASNLTYNGSEVKGTLFDGNTYAENVNMVRDAILDLSTQVPLTISEIQDMYAKLGQSGVGLNDLVSYDSSGNLSGYVKDAAMVAAAFDMEASSIADMMMQAENAFGYTHDQVLELFDAINYTAANSPTTASELVSSVFNSLAMGEIAGLGGAGTVALTDALLASGLAENKAGTTAKNMLTYLSAGNAATGTQQKAFASLGLNASDVAKGMQDNGLGTLEDIFSRIRQLPSEEQISTIKGIFNMRAIEGGSMIANNPELLMNAITLAATTEESRGYNSIAREFDIEAASPEAVSQMLQNSMTATQIELGESWSSIKTEGMKKLLELVIKIRDNLPDLSQLSEKIIPLMNDAFDYLSGQIDVWMPKIKEFFSWLSENPKEAIEGIISLVKKFALMSIAPQITGVASNALSIAGGIGSLIGSAGSSLFGGSSGGKTYGTSKRKKKTSLLASILGTGSSIGSSALGLAGSVFDILSGKTQNDAFASWQNSADNIARNAMAKDIIGSLSKNVSALSLAAGSTPAASATWNAAESMQSALLSNGLLSESFDISGKGSKEAVQNATARISTIGSALKNSIHYTNVDEMSGLSDAEKDIAILNNSAKLGIIPNVKNIDNSLGILGDLVPEYKGETKTSLLKGLFGSTANSASAALGKTKSGKKLLDYFGGIGTSAKSFGSSLKLFSDESGLIGLGGAFKEAASGSLNAMIVDPLKNIGGGLAMVGGAALKDFAQLPGISNIISAGQLAGGKVSGALGTAGSFLKSGVSLVGGKASKVGGAALGVGKAGAGLLGSIWSPAAGAFTGILGGALPIVGGISAAIAGVSLLKDNMDGVGDVITGLFGEEAGKAFDSLTEKAGNFSKIFEDGGLKASLQGVTDIITNNFGEGAGQAFESFLDKAQPAVTKVGDVVKGLPGLTQEGGLMSATSGAQAKVTEVFGQDAGAAFTGLVQMARPFLVMLGNIAQFAEEKVKPILEWMGTTIVPIILQAISTAAPIVSGILTNIGDAIMVVANIIADTIISLEPVIATVLSFLGESVIPFVLGVFEDFSEGILQFVEGAKTVFSGIIEFVTGVFTGNWEEAWTGVKNIFGGIFEALEGLIKAPLNAVISLINRAIDGINGLISGITDNALIQRAIDVVLGVDIRGAQIPHIPELATGGFTNGVSIAGEAGTEAVISFDSKYRSQNIDTWLKAGQMLLGGRNLIDLGNVTSESGTEDSGNVTIYFSPNITINGNGDTATIKQALKEAQTEFEAMYEKMLKKKRRVSYA